MKTILKKKLKRPVEVIVYVLCITDIPLQKLKKKSQESHSSKYMNALAK